MGSDNSDWILQLPQQGDGFHCAPALPVRQYVDAAYTCILKSVHLNGSCHKESQFSVWKYALSSVIMKSSVVKILTQDGSDHELIKHINVNYRCIEKLDEYLKDGSQKSVKSCNWDDLPPHPSMSIDNETCNNVVTSVHYEFTMTDQLQLDATVLLANLTLNKMTELKQNFTVQFRKPLPDQYKYSTDSTDSTSMDFSCCSYDL